MEGEEEGRGEGGGGERGGRGRGEGEGVGRIERVRGGEGGSRHNATKDKLRDRELTHPSNIPTTPRHKNPAMTATMMIQMGKQATANSFTPGLSKMVT